MSRPSIFVVMDGLSNQTGPLKFRLSQEGYEVIESVGINNILTILSFDPKHSQGLVIVEAHRNGGWDGVKIAEQIRQTYKNLPLLLITSHSSEQLAMAARKSEVNAYLIEPCSLEEIVANVNRLFAGSIQGAPHITPPASATNLNEDLSLIGQSQAIQKIKTCIRNIAASECTVLITGETGTGKGLSAELIHKNSRRHQEPFVSVNCAAIPETLFESELFGYEKGAFTGANATTIGKFEQAKGGTILLDEVGDIPAHSQAKLLRVIESKTVHRLGGREGIPLKARILAATNQELEQLVEEGRFRSDLYYRLNVARIQLPPLRDRKEDIPLLLAHYIKTLQPQLGHKVEGFTEESLEALKNYDWPGNVRELSNFLEATFVNGLPKKISFENFPEHFHRKLQITAGPIQVTEGPIQDECSILIRCPAQNKLE